MDCVIIDDEPAAIDVLKFHLSNMPFMVLKKTFRDPLDALEYLQKNTVDLVFLDINMPKLSGISFPKFLQNPPLIIFTTAYSEYALDSYEHGAVDYLLKPIEFDKLLKAVMKAKQLFETNLRIPIANNEIYPDFSEQTIFIKSGSEFHQLFIQNIKYIESDGNYVTFYTDKRPILARYKISEVLELLPEQYFVRIHRSYIVALKHIETVKKHCVIIDSKEIPISSNYREKFISIIDDIVKKRENNI
ncbi:LytR/AlgR family response regulator transcription factor [Flavobacterium degerlachei]|jgi:DNA-binding LytR/AlgR family response regulator|uniref:Two component transcriptional regulator, LytTR family n=1 Tax=Flavobacterium degerlachei TaxID=229203 RepID=A0A1H3E570_9FLAO|nr:LytTR family DNA-binding domain-containing protein [Flavobacterium degerlachei]SDX73760.1 two component transcriptional regulator, LytTR family [Flavobacterium degerlachei]